MHEEAQNFDWAGLDRCKRGKLKVLRTGRILLGNNGRAENVKIDDKASLCHFCKAEYPVYHKDEYQADHKEKRQKCYNKGIKKLKKRFEVRDKERAKALTLIKAYQTDMVNTAKSMATAERKEKDDAKKAIRSAEKAVQTSHIK